MKVEDLEIAIIGGGIGGLTTAIALRRKNASVTLFEQATEIGEVGAGLQISANAIRVLNALGLNPMSWPHNTPREVDLRDYNKGQLVKRIAMNKPADATDLKYPRAELITGL